MNLALYKGVENLSSANDLKVGNAMFKKTKCHVSYNHVSL